MCLSKNKNVQKQVCYILYFYYFCRKNKNLKHMRKKYLKLFFVGIILFITACSNDFINTPLSANEDSKLIEYGKTFANIHNEGLDAIYTKLANNIQTRVEKNISQEKIIEEATDSFINQHSATSRTVGNTNIDYSIYKTTTINDIKKRMSPKERQYVEAILIDDSEADYLLKAIVNDTTLSVQKRQAVICFITTYKASSEYWDKHYNEWLELLSTNKEQTRSIHFNWKEVAIADAYWGYTGMLSSGLNPWVGGGSAAVGSAFACLK